MARFFAIVVVISLLISDGNAQFRSQREAKPTVSESITRMDENGLLFGWFDPNRLFVRNSYELSYTTLGGGQGMSLGTLTSSLSYQISNPLSVAFDVSMMHQPFGGMNSRFGSDLTGIRLTRAQLDYRPSKNMLFQIQYRQIPALYWLNNYDYGFFRTGPTGFSSSSPKEEEEKP